MPACEIAWTITKHGSIQRELVKILAAAKQPVPDWLDGGAWNGGIRRLSKFSHAVIIYEVMKPKQIYTIDRSCFLCKIVCVAFHNIWLAR